MGAFKAAREAYDEHEKVLKLDAARKDAGLIVGTYRYIVASLAMPLRWAAYMVGFGGGREQGLRLVEGAASLRGRQPGRSPVHARRLYNREKQLRRGAGAAGDSPRAVSAESPDLARKRIDQPARRQERRRRTVSRRWHCVCSQTTRAVACSAKTRLWYLKRGTARAGLGRMAQARIDLEKAVSTEGRSWAHGRAHLELGKLDLKDGNQASANEHLRTAVRLCESDNDETTAAESRRLIR